MKVYGIVFLALAFQGIDAEGGLRRELQRGGGGGGESLSACDLVWFP